jgi:hypothetical protein
VAIDGISTGDFRLECEREQGRRARPIKPVKEQFIQLTSTSCTDPQKQLAVASFSVDQPSLERPTMGKPRSSKEVMIE